jgi:hypothetical protein
VESPESLTRRGECRQLRRSVEARVEVARSAAGFVRLSSDEFTRRLISRETLHVALWRANHADLFHTNRWARELRGARGMRRGQPALPTIKVVIVPNKEGLQDTALQTHGRLTSVVERSGCRLLVLVPNSPTFEVRH